MAQSQEVVNLSPFLCPVITEVGKTDFQLEKLIFPSRLPLLCCELRALNCISSSQTGPCVRTPGELLEMLICGSH